MSRPKKYRMPEQADDPGRTRGRIADRRRQKRAATRLERRRAKDNPECMPGYRVFRGYET